MRSSRPSAGDEPAKWRKEFSAATARETGALAARLARALAPGDVVALEGDLGAGKTTFARAIVGAFAAEAGEPPPEVPSPTFTLVQIYEFPRATLWHFDLYRIERPHDALELGLEEAFGEGIALIEWPERLGPLLPARRIHVRLAFENGDSRRIDIAAPAELAARLSAAFAA